MRPMMSGLPPGAVPTMMRTVRDGHCCAASGRIGAAAPAASASNERRVRFTSRAPSRLSLRRDAGLRGQLLGDRNLRRDARGELLRRTGGDLEAGAVRLLDRLRMRERRAAFLHE